MQRLIADRFYRSRWQAAFFIPLVAFMLWLTAQMGQPARAFSISAGVALGLGPQLALRSLPRALWYLPLARRDIWRAGWLVATVATTTALLGAKLVAMMAVPLIPFLDIPTADPTLSFAMVALSSVYDLAATGLGCALVVVVTRPQPPGVISTTLRGSAEGAIQLAMIGLWYSGQYLEGRLPVHWGDLTPATSAALVAALAVTAATYFYLPSEPLIPRARDAAARARTSPARVRPPGGLSGLPRLLAHEYRLSIVVGAGLSLASLLVVIVMEGLYDQPPAIADVIRAELLFLDGAGAPTAPIEAVTALSWYGFFVGCLVARFPSMLRHLRVLPIGIGRLNMILVCWPAAIWASAGLVLVVTRYLLVGPAVTPTTIAALLAISGLSAVAAALTLPLNGLQRVFVLSLVLGVVPLVHLLSIPTAPRLALTGLAAMALAAVINQRTLRRAATYRISHRDMAEAAARIGL